jgi:hypothetical protein
MWSKSQVGSVPLQFLYGGPYAHLWYIVTGIWDGFVPWTGISWATGHRYCIHCILEGVPAMRPLDVP